MKKKIDNLADLVKYILYRPYGSTDICIGLHGDIDISEELSINFRKRMLKLLNKE